MPLRVALLGTVRVWRGAMPCPLGPTQRRAIVAVLALAAGKPVSRHELTSCLWPQGAPERAANVIQTNVKHLRKVLEPGRPARAASAVLPAVGDGYSLRLDPEAVDASRFRRLVAQAREARRAGATDRLWTVSTEAIAMWDPPVADIPVLATHPSVARLIAEWQLILSWYAEAATTSGRADEVVAILQEQARLRPLDESVHTLLLKAYAALGRQSDAIDLFTRVRQRLVDELGVDAGQELVQAYEKLLRRPATAKTGPATPHAPAERAVPAEPGTSAEPAATKAPVTPPPAQLPAATDHFVDRVTQMADLDRALAQRRQTGQGGIVAIVGPPGIGKTALGLVWAHRVAEHFPDGQFYVDLRGFTGAAPLRPEVVLERFLRAFEPPDSPAVADIEELSAQFRTLLAHRRILVFLDNSACTEQVVPLLPGRGASVAVVTSRSNLDALVALHGARRVMLKPLDRSASVDLMLRLAPQASEGGGAREALTEIAQRCGRLPLALRIAASRIHPDGGYGVAELASAMADETSRLDELETDSGEISVRAVFATWLSALDPVALRMLCLMSSHPGPRPSLAACAALAGLSVADARGALARLVSAHLVMPAGQQHYVLHDLVRLIAGEQLRLSHSPAEQHEASQRLLVWYRDLADSADCLLRPGERPNFGTPARTDLFADHAEAFAWFEAEAMNLSAAVEHAAETFPRQAWQIAAAMFGWLNRGRNRAQWAALYTLAADAAARAGDPAGEAVIAGRLAVAYSQMGLASKAARACLRAHRIRAATGDLYGAATALLNLAAVHLDQGRPEPAIRWLHRASAQLGDAGDKATHFRMLWHSNLGEAHRLSGRFTTAVEHYEAALELSREAGHTRDGAIIEVALSGLRLDLGDPDAALRHASLARESAACAADALTQAEAQECLGRALLALGRVAAAGEELGSALETYARAGHRRTETLRRLVERITR